MGAERALNGEKSRLEWSRSSFSRGLCALGGFKGPVRLWPIGQVAVADQP